VDPFSQYGATVTNLERRRKLATFLPLHEDSVSVEER
jgi:hypothetical protein